MTHALKTWPEYFKAIESEAKTFEIRLFDRPFRVGEKLLLQEYDPEKQKYTGKELEREITYIFPGTDRFGVNQNYCVMGIKPIEY